MSVSTTYLLTVALHAAILSAVAGLTLLVLRQARHRSAAAIAGLLAIGILPWLTALRPAQPAAPPTPDIQTQVPIFPTWTVATVYAPPPIQTTAEPVAASAKSVLPDLLTCLISLWAAGTGIGLLRLVFASCKVRIWQKSLLPLDDTAWQILHALTPEMPARTHFRLSETTASPCVSGFWQPRIILPRFLFAPGPGDGLHWAVRHEAAHWKAGDSRWILLFAFIRSVNWWNPVVHRLVSNWADAREQICDLQATGISISRADYGMFLISMACKITNPPPLTVAMAKRLRAIRLKRRITCLLNATAGWEKPVGKYFITLGSAVFIGCAVLVSSVKINASEPTKETPAPEPAAVQQPVAAVSVAEPKQVVEKQAVDEELTSQVRTTNFLIMSSRRPRIKEGEIIPDKAALDELLKTVANEPGAKLVTCPSITNKYGQKCTMEIVRENPLHPMRYDKATRKPITPFAGVVIVSESELVGAEVRITMNLDYNFVPGGFHPVSDMMEHRPANSPAPEIRWDKLKSTTRVITGVLGAGQALCSDLGEIEPGKFLQIFTRVESSDPTGRPLKKFTKLAPSPSENVQGKLRLSGVQVDMLVDGDKVPTAFSYRDLEPSKPDTVAYWQTAPGAKTRMLQPVEIPLNARHQPWPDVEGLEISAIAASDFKWIHLSDHAAVSAGVRSKTPRLWDNLASGSWMEIGLKTDDPTIARRVFFKIEAIPDLHSNR